MYIEVILANKIESQKVKAGGELFNEITLLYTFYLQYIHFTSFTSRSL